MLYDCVICYMLYDMCYVICYMMCLQTQNSSATRHPGDKLQLLLIVTRSKIWFMMVPWLLSVCKGYNDLHLQRTTHLL